MMFRMGFMLLFLLAFWSYGQDKLVYEDLKKVSAFQHATNPHKYDVKIRIETKVKNLSFDFTSNPIIDVKSDKHGYTIFTNFRSRALNIRHPDYPLLTIWFSDDADLGRNEFWQAVVYSTKPRVGNELPVTFQITPKGAQLKVDGKVLMGGGPYFLRVGDHTVEISRSGYERKREAITVDKKNVLFRYTLKEVAEVPVNIGTTPSGASVTLDGVNLGESPITEFFQQGRYRLVIRRDGFAPVDKTITVGTSGYTENITLTELLGYLTIETSSKATVYLNGDEITALENIPLKPMIAKIRVTQSGATTLEKRVTIRAHDRKKVSLYPEVLVGTVQVGVAPFGSKVTLVGTGKNYSATGSKVFNNVPVGEYRLTVEYGGYESHSERVTVEANSRVKKKVRLEKTAVTPPERTPSGNMVFVQGGTFKMGSNDGESDEKPIHSVTVDDFYMGKYEVTVREFKQFIDERSYKTDAEKRGNSWVYTTKWEKKNGVDWRCDVKGNRRPTEEYNHPVIHVSWNDAVAYCTWVSKKTGKKYRLPTEVSPPF